MLKTVLIASSLILSSTLAAAAGPCESAAHRAFDFWIGEWNVHTPDGKLAGVNRIERGVQRMRPA